MQTIPYLCFTNKIKQMKKFILSLKIVVMVAMIVLMTIVSITNSIDTIIKSIYIFFGFACLGVVPIILENKLYKKTTE